MRLSQVPLFSGKGPSEVRPLVIARIERLSVLNGSIINPRERRDSEKGYLRSIFNEKARLCPAGSDSGNLSLSSSQTYNIHLNITPQPKRLRSKQT
jgi:hypothetical protein